LLLGEEFLEYWLGFFERALGARAVEQVAVYGVDLAVYQDLWAFLFGGAERTESGLACWVRCVAF
jgi:hypothetical protein